MCVCEGGGEGGGGIAPSTHHPDIASPAVAHAYASNRERSLKEAAYQVMPEYWLRRVLQGALLANCNIPEKCIRMMLSKKELSELPEDSTDILVYMYTCRFNRGETYKNVAQIN